MTTEPEQEFFKVFGIEPISKWHKCRDYSCIYCDEYEFCSRGEFIYPDITAEKLLEMICIYNSTYTNGYTNYSLLNERSTEELKGHILRNCLKVRDDVYNQIQQLFKEEEWQII